MLVPRAYGYTARREEDKRRTASQRTSAAADSPSPPQMSPESRRAFGWRPDSFHRSAPRSHPYPQHPTVSAPAPCSTTPSLPNPPSRLPLERENVPRGLDGTSPRSLPMPVPQANRSRNRLQESSRSTSSTARRTDQQRSSSKHDPTAMSPAVAALLAMTSIPRPRPGRIQTRKASSLPRRMSTQQLMEYWKEEDDIPASPESGSSLDVLLSPPEDDEMFARSHSSGSLDEYLHGRSLSSESMPSLSVDDRSVMSWSQPSTPHGYVRRASRDKAFSQPKSYERIAEHPLSMESCISEGDEEDYSMCSTRSTTPDTSSEGMARSPPSSQWPASFKSNLTASISALRSSLRSLSNFAMTPYTMPDDILSRGLFSDAGRITSEMRPRPLDRPPTPELRRYLNPSAYSYSPSRDFHLHGSQIEQVDYEKLAVSATGAIEQMRPGSIIALQDRVQVAASGALLDPASGVPSDKPTQPGNDAPQHRREIRENGEFLRICVLETNMRRAGKIDGPGKAKIWLPARQFGVFESARVENKALERRREVPRRWVGVTA